MNAYLKELIQNEALPQRNCMLTVFDVSGESGFLYFKDTQLIEVNAGKNWGIKALTQVFAWKINSYAIGELPVGIKRTLWDPLEKLIAQIEQDAGADGEMGNESVTHISLDDPMFMPVIKLSNLPGFQAAYREDEHGVQLLVGKTSMDALTRDWFADYFRKLDDLGSNLGAGFTGDWFVEFANGRVWNFRSPMALIVMSDNEVMPDDFEENCRAILEGRA
jgi:hypothetical protein